jgi:putative endonuclease
MVYTVYILYSISRDRYYISQTEDLDRRLLEHNSGYSKSTGSGIPWELVFKREFRDRSEAVQYEHALKRMKSRRYIEKLVSIG